VSEVQNPENITVDGKTVSLQDYTRQHQELLEEIARLRKTSKKTVLRYRR